jgi:hypothetical protein
MGLLDWWRRRNQRLAEEAVPEPEPREDVAADAGADVPVERHPAANAE